MTNNDSKLTRKMSENRNYFQCYYNNRGYCKFRDECRYQHYTEVCSQSLCKERQCKFRHPRVCKFGDNCHFLRKKYCLYKHDSSKSDDQQKKEVVFLKEEITKLKAEIQDLRNVVEMKEKDLREIIKKEADQNRVIKALNEENRCLKQSIGRYSENEIGKSNAIEKLTKENKDLKDENESLNVKIANQQVKYLDIMVRYNDITKVTGKTDSKKMCIENYDCKTCEISFVTKTSLNEHKKLHCDICSKIFPNILQLKKHENISGHY
jgi:hypothetical protein